MTTPSNIPPIPYQTQMTGLKGLLTNPWSAWFRELVLVINNATQIDATTAAAAAEAAEAAAETYSSNAQGYASNAAASATTASTAAINASSSASSASASALNAASAASDIEALVDSIGSQYPADYITDVVAVPVHRQFITFQRVKIAAGGSLQISGRGRIL